MATFSKYNSFIYSLCTKKHNIVAGGGDTFRMALSARAPVATDAYADIAQISYTNLTVPALVTSFAAVAGNGVWISFSDATITCAGTSAAWRYIIIYNDTASPKELVGYMDIGASVTLSNGEGWLVDMPAVLITIS